MSLHGKAYTHSWGELFVTAEPGSGRFVAFHWVGKFGGTQVSGAQQGMRNGVPKLTIHF